ncbi:hypothetical protein DPMN_177959 [Dreissena polymorpha]|uniref:Uncharacterized protein n=1 Tax=Dreissena polymorpha TaxID=45954 RepID=A0A9D4ED67_DREPO|nr:hypothetical protein DPMN_177959 [Dreissena polymorpha]
MKEKRRNGTIEISWWKRKNVRQRKKRGRKRNKQKVRMYVAKKYTKDIGLPRPVPDDVTPSNGQSVNARVFTNQMWTNGQWTKTNSKTSPEQSDNFQLVREVNKSNAKNETSISHKENCPPPGGHFHDDWAKKVTSRVFTSVFLLYKYKKTAPPPGSHVIQLTGTIFELNSRIKETNVLTKFHENWAKHVTSRVEKCPANWPPCFSLIWTIFELSRDINKTNILSNFHDDWANIVTSSVFTRKTAPPTGGHVFQRTRTTFELNQHIIKTFHAQSSCNFVKMFVTSTVFTSFQLHRDIIGTNLLTKFHEDLTKNVTSRVFTRKTAPPTGGHVFQQTRTTFELNQHII